ncbi:polysaccharide deacetylase family protein [Ruegeria sp. Ofav3-42]|uniref:polysaccharide deacetylase family protein n=1 Tax=Ruegeria sp. Ofav3-42 TaxID=2917759 RepID=UPI001EF5B9C9|nr:polysaccharide deacetylase family protein [Ruegeria sp. Ofav3-42]MCG7518587.1 polysaccharide deacetylase family protein [Ruegeria sp. Ofav3-42]
MTADWSPLTAELAIWQQQGLTLPLWWRDDDAISSTPQLDRLSAMSDKLGVPVHLAVIPRDVEIGLVDYVSARSNLIPVVHGWAHKNHAPKGEKKSEFRLHRPLPEIIQNARSGALRMRTLFADQLCPMFVPPWNRIAPEVVNELPAAGYRILSTATPRTSPQAAPALEQINTHLDPIDWRGTRGLAAPETLIAKTAQLLRDRREGRADNAEPFGVLTHHLVHDEDIWAFSHDLLHRLLEGPGYVWSVARD